MNNNLEKENASGINTSRYNANKPLRILTATSIIGDKVKNSKGEEIGEIKDIMINLDYGKIEYVVVKFGGFIGIGEKLFAIPFYALEVDSKDEKFILNVDKEFMEKAPGFDKDHWPETNNHYETTNSHWGSFMGPNVG